MENCQHLQHVNTLISKNDIDVVRVHFIFKFGKVELLSIAIENNKTHAQLPHSDTVHHAEPSECVGCAIVAYLTSVFVNIDDFCLSPDELRLGWAMIKPSEENLENRYLISISTDIQTAPIYSIYPNRKEKLHLN